MLQWISVNRALNTDLHDVLVHGLPGHVLHVCVQTVLGQLEEKVVRK